MSLIVCGQCDRHVRGPGLCPFCGAQVESPSAPSPTAAPRRSRAALLVGAAAVSVACSSAQPMYGAPIPDSGGADQAAADAGNDSSPGPMYGAVPPDGGVD